MLTSRSFESEQDPLIVFGAWACVFLCALVAAYSSRAGLSATTVAVILVIAIVASAMALSWAHAIRYFVTDESLEVRVGLIRIRVPLRAILMVQPAGGENQFAFPAVSSFDRALHVRYLGSYGGILVSPGDPQAFLVELTSRDPGLRFDGERVARSHVDGDGAA